MAVIQSPFLRARIARAASTAGGATPVFSYANGFAGSSGAINLCCDAVLSGSVIRLINNPGHESAGAWYTTKQPPNAFTTQFTFTPSGLGSGIAQSGMCFVVQNTVSPPGQPGAVGASYAGDANMCGYGGANNQWPPVDSIGIKFDAGNGSNNLDYYPSGGLPSSTGLYFNGGPSVAPGGSLGLVPFNDLNPYGINFYSGHTFEVTIVYDGSLLTMVIADTAGGAQARFVWPLNLAYTTNTSGNYVGFVAGTASVGLFELSSWSYWSGYNTRLATPTFSPAPGEYSGAQTVTISYPPGSTCYYTTNGLLPTSASTKYTGSAINVSANAVIQAVAIQTGYTDSLVAQGVYQINTSNVINFPSGFSAGDLIPVGYAYLSGSAYRVSDTQTNTSGAAWFPVPVNIQTFSTAFTLQFNSGAGGNGMCFVIQNNPPPYTSSTGKAINWSGGPTVVSGESNGMGYGGMNAVNGTAGQSFGILNSVALAFDLWSVRNSVGVYTNGATPAGSQVATGLTFNSSHAFNVSLSYSGTTLSLTMTDTVTGAKFTHNFTINIPSTVGANTAYVGFTGGTGGATAVQAVQSWTYTASPGQTQTLAVPAPPSNLRVQ
jgi:hypothetical protein